LYFVTDAWCLVQVNSTQHLQESCQAESAAQNISSATSQAIGSALAPMYGANACSNIYLSGMDITAALLVHFIMLQPSGGHNNAAFAKQNSVAASVFCDLCTLHSMAYTCLNSSSSQLSIAHDVEPDLLNNCCTLSIKQWEQGKLVLPSGHAPNARHLS